MAHKYTSDKNYCKVRDHSYFTGKYKGAVYSLCNLKYSISKKGCFIHSGFNYDDYHFIIKEVANRL